MSRNQTYGLLRATGGPVVAGLRGPTLSVQAVRDRRIPIFDIPPGWPVVGTLPRIPEVVVLSSSNVPQDYSFSGVTAYTPDLDVATAFGRAKSIIESARPGRTFVTPRGLHAGTIAGWPNNGFMTYANSMFEDVPVGLGVTDAFILPSILVIQYGNPAVLRNLRGPLDSEIVSAVANYPRVAVRLWDDGATSTISGVPQKTLSDTGPARASRISALGMDYRFMGVADAPLDGDEIAATIADHFGFTL